MRACAARADGSIEVLAGVAPAARSGSRLLALSRDNVLPLPEGTTLMHLPGRTAMVLDGARPLAVEGMLPLAAVLPVGLLRTLLPASRREPGARRLPLYGYAAVAEHGGRLMAAALSTDAFDWWRPAGRDAAAVAGAVESAARALPRNRLVAHLAVCATENRCYTAQNTFLRHYEGALPASPACNADCLGCISLQTDGEAPAPQPRMRFAPTAAELAELAAYHLDGDGAIVSFGQGCEGEPLTRDGALLDATRRIRQAHPGATIHVNTNGSKPEVLRRLIEAGCNSVRISAISFDESAFRAYYRPVGYGLDDVLESCRVTSRSGAQLCLNLLTFPGLSDDPAEQRRTVHACRDVGVQQIQWRSLNVDHDWLVDRLRATGHALDAGMGMRAAVDAVRAQLPGVTHGNFTRPVPAPSAAV